MRLSVSAIAGWIGVWVLFQGPPVKEGLMTCQEGGLFLAGFAIFATIVSTFSAFGKD